jgi:hypothetical protein
MAEIKNKSKHYSYSCDGFELASASKCSVGLTMGKEILGRLNNKKYNKQKDAAEFGNRAPGIYFISNVLLLSFLINLLLLID